jgi:hypothetical protein
VDAQFTMNAAAMELVETPGGRDDLVWISQLEKGGQ